MYVGLWGRGCFYLFKVYLFYSVSMGCVARWYICVPCVCVVPPRKLTKGIESPELVWQMTVSTMLVLGIELKSIARATYKLVYCSWSLTC